MSKHVGMAYAADARPAEPVPPTMYNGARYAAVSNGAKRSDVPGRCPSPSHTKITM